MALPVARPLGAVGGGGLLLELQVHCHLGGGDGEEVEEAAEVVGEDVVVVGGEESAEEEGKESGRCEILLGKTGEYS